MQKKDFIIKTSIFIAGVVLIATLWFLFTKMDTYLKKIDELKQENKEQSELVERLEYAQAQQQLKADQTEEKSVKESVDLFIQSVFTINQNNYKERKKDGENILSNDIFTRIFGSDEELEVNFEYRPSDVNVYVDIMEEGQSSAFVTFDNMVKDLNNDSTEYEYIALEVELNKQGDLWVIHDFETINEQIIEKLD